MAEFVIECPHCGEKLEAEDGMAGMEVECPSCEKTFVVPQKPKPVLKKAGRPTPGNSEDGLFRAEVNESSERWTKAIVSFAYSRSQYSLAWY